MKSIKILKKYKNQEYKVGTALADIPTVISIEINGSFFNFYGLSQLTMMEMVNPSNDLRIF